MKNVEKGNIFEKSCIPLIKQYIDNGYFGKKDFITLSTKKKYPTKLGDSNIEFDLTVEFQLPNQASPSLIYFIECKNYAGRLPRDQVKKFKTDIEDVTGINAKAILISSTELQRGAYEYAKINNIMVMVAESIDNHKIVLPRTLNKKASNIPFFQKVKPVELLNNELILVQEQIDNAILSAFIESQNQVSFGIDKLSKKEIANISKNELNKIGSEYLIQGYGIEPKDLISYLEREYGIKVKYDKIINLGEIDLENKLITINISLRKTPKEIFVLSHEFGHFILHNNLSINSTLYDAFSDNIQNFEKNILKNPKQWVEWQANYFASTLILPDTSTIAWLWKIKQRMGLSKGNLIINNYNDKEVNDIIKKLAYHFNCSKQCLLIRMTELSLIENKSNLRKIAEIIPEIVDEYII